MALGTMLITRRRAATHVDLVVHKLAEQARIEGIDAAGELRVREQVHSGVQMLSGQQANSVADAVHAQRRMDGGTDEVWNVHTPRLPPVLLAPPPRAGCCGLDAGSCR